MNAHCEDAEIDLRCKTRPERSCIIQETLKYASSSNAYLHLSFFSGSIHIVPYHRDEYGAAFRTGFYNSEAALTT